MTEAQAARAGRGLNLERIVGTALTMIDETGVGSASMRAVAARLGVEAMSLYRYVQNRDRLLDAVAERVLAELEIDEEVRDGADDGWRDYLIRLAHGVRRFARAHPYVFPVIATRSPQAPWIRPPLRSLRWIESMLATLTEAGFSDEQSLFVYRSFNSFLLGFLLLETGALTRSDPRPGDGARPRDDIDPGVHPTIHRLADRLAEDRFGEEFDVVLGALLDRVASEADRGVTAAPRSGRFTA